MFEIIYMKAEFEPWWMFEGWEENIISRHSFKDLVECTIYLEDLLQNLRIENEYEKVKSDCYYAFWSNKEKKFCDACDDDLQIYHGVILMKEGNPFILKDV